MDDSAVQVSRILFGFAVAYHYLFVPLTIGLVGVIAIIDGLFLYSKEGVWRDAGNFWRRFFVLNFAFGILTGYVLRLLLKSHWSQYAYQVEQVFHLVFDAEAALAPWLYGLALLLALGRYMSPAWRVFASFFLALAVVAQSTGILALNAWMQYPIDTMVDTGNGRFMVNDLWALLHNPLLPSKVAHTVAAAYVLGSMFVVSLSAACLLRAQHQEMATASLRVGAIVALLSLLATAYAGHSSGELIARLQPTKFAAMEAIWEDESAPESLTVFAIPDPDGATNRHALTLPYVLGWLANSTGSAPIKSIAGLKEEASAAIRSALSSPPLLARQVVPIEQYQQQVGYLSLLGADPKKTSAADITTAAAKVIPPVAPLFWGFRAMVAVWVVLMGAIVFLVWMVRARGGRGLDARLLWALVLVLPLPWVATISGWVVCELGRQPWTLMGAVTTLKSNGPIGASQGALTLLGMGVAYAVMLFINIAWSLRWLRLGPSSSWLFQLLTLRAKRMVAGLSSVGIGR